MSKSLHFRQDGTFTIAQFTDLHWQNGESEDLRTAALIQQVIDAESPDLVVFTGDVIYSDGCTDPRQSFRDVVAIIERNGIPWAAVFGNHDTESLVTREELMQVQMEHEHCLSEAGPSDIAGEGNFVIQVQDAEGENPVATLYFLDSGSYSEIPEIEGYQWIQRNQIDWYVEQSKSITAANQGEPVPALAFFHIPLPEYKEVWKKETCYGSHHEKVCCPPINSGFFSAMLDMDDVVGTFCGHDHINDYWGTLHGIRLCYGRASGYHTYGKDGFRRGSRLIRLHKGERDFSTWIRLDNGTVIDEPKEHHPKG
ncbi:phosphohydrolase [Paenibacillus baekrokdamisoli]|uniref:Phosphohydrolase n=1 Tax=Paenibacillus baekrokdamisoli TaxID=1712516 RepID=A0A3G9IUW7_9BACL|nr:metallophosphoesterase family protein [Paenibacillus baekrokdamisoli]MBB3070836.1 3',5'-cyclic AMP phosphodiesterase CpdA [Paenibacillus baekrokdamisoli]BBH22226.1 phosphohydrolase [Paenibacillus baekrokdamisoli]